MTFFKNRTVFFVDLFGFIRGSFSRRSKKQLGVISKAIQSLQTINEDIHAANISADRKIAKARSNMSIRSKVHADNVSIIRDLSSKLNKSERW